MKSRAVGKGGIDEWHRQIKPPATGSEHPLDQVPDLSVVEQDAGELVVSVSYTEHPSRSVYPDFLDCRIIQKRLQRTKSSYTVKNTSLQRFPIVDARKAAGLRSEFVVPDDLVHEVGDASRAFAAGI